VGCSTREGHQGDDDDSKWLGAVSSDKGTIPCSLGKASRVSLVMVIRTTRSGNKSKMMTHGLKSSQQCQGQNDRW